MIQRILASLPGYFYGTSKDGLYVHFYHNSELNWRLEDGTPLRVTQSTDYPWKGRVTLTVSPALEKDFTLYARVPQWSATSSATVNGANAGAPRPGAASWAAKTWALPPLLKKRLATAATTAPINNDLHMTGSSKEME